MPICTACGTDVEKYANGKKCRTCYNAYMADYMLKRYHRRRAEAIVELGGACTRCGSTDRLEFDHIEREFKAGEVAKWLTQGEEKYKAELLKCQLLCRSCHEFKTSGEFSVGHGGGKTGVRNCYCELCKPLKYAYMVEWRERKRSNGPVAQSGRASDS